MRMALFAFLALALAPGVTLRYRYPVGQTLRYEVEQSVQVIVKVGDQPARPTTALQTRTTQERRVLSYERGTARVTEHTIRGTTTRTLPMPRMTEVVPDIERTYAFDTLGRCLEVKRSAPAGSPTPAPQFLDGLAVPLPQKPVRTGLTWSGETTATGPNGQGTIRLAYSGKVTGAEKRDGRSCIRLEITVRGRFAQAAAAGAPEATGEVQGAIVQLFDPQEGLDRRTQAELTIVTRGRTTVDDKPVEAVWTTSLRSTQTLAR